MRQGFFCATTEDGKIEFCIVVDGVATGMKLDPEYAASLAAQVLTAAQSISPGHQTNPDRLAAEIAPSMISLGPSRSPNHECLIASFGKACLALAIPTETILKIAEGLRTLSASGPRH